MAAQPSIGHTTLWTFPLALCIQCIIEISGLSAFHVLSREFRQLTRLHSRGDSTPPRGHPESTIPRRVVFPLVIVIFLLPSIWQVQSTIAIGTPCPIVAVLITSPDAWLKAAPSIPMNVQTVNPLGFSWSSVRFTALLRAVSVELPDV